ncbi:NAD(P)-dependent oxidoreductase [Candidatus Nomurabacteria bacterium]|nr:NAD(P)-dependent oxidoreductase [Candidatus Nomurabacteria bacterium]
MKILITGATGFIGQHLVQRLLDHGDDVSILVRTTSQTDTIPKEVSIITLPETQNELEEIFKRERFDGVVHLASLYLMSHTPEDIESLIDSNVKFGTKIINAATTAGVTFFINTGSFVQHFESRPYSPTNLYAATKQAFQDICQYYAETTNTIILTLELYNTFGPGDTRPKLFNLWSNAIKEGKTLEMSPGEQIIDISYIDNVIDGYLLAIEHATSNNAKSFTGHSYTLMSPERMTLKKLAKMFAKGVKGDLKINFGGFPYRDRETMIPMDKGEILPGWSPKVSLLEGIQRSFLNK